jgi:hypothetical protein
MELNEANNDFDFSQLKLSLPTAIQGGAYFTKYLYNSKPLYIQTPKSTTKQGFIKNGKKYHCDLMFDNNAVSFIHWIEKLEEHSQQLIFSNADKWFQNELSLNDIEEAFNTTIKVYKSGTYYLVRVYSKINNITQQPVVKVYDEYEKPVSIKDITNKTNVLSILEFQGIKFTSRSFQIEIELKQLMVVKEEDAIFESCLIKKTNTNNISLVSVDSVKQQDILDKQENKETISVSFSKTNTDYIENIDSNENTINSFKDVIDNITEENDNIEEVQDNVEDYNNNILSILKIEELDEDEDIEDTNIENTSSYNKNNVINEGLDLELDMDIKKDIDNIDNVVEDIQFQTQEKEQQMKELEEKEQEYTDFDMFNIEDLESEVDIEEIKELKELDNQTPLESITLKNPNQVYFDLYKEAKKKAKDAKKNAILAYLEVKNIKKTYMLNDINDSDSDINSDISETDI